MPPQETLNLTEQVLAELMVGLVDGCRQVTRPAGSEANEPGTEPDAQHQPGDIADEPENGEDDGERREPFENGRQGRRH